MLKRALGLAGFLLGVIWFGGQAVAQQASTPVNVGVDPTRLIISGCASPRAFVQIFNDNSPIGTVVAGNDGRFTKTLTFPAQQNGLRNIRIYFDDVNGRTSSIITNNINLAAQTTTVLNQLLPTTIEHEPEPIAIGNFLIFRGTTCPKALVNVKIDNNLTVAAQSDDRGNWYVIADSENYFVGAHVYQALSALGGQTSQSTQKYQFTAIGPGGAGGGEAELARPSITEPADLFLSSTQNVTVRGTGPANAQLEVFVDNEPAGSLFVNARGEWSFMLSMAYDLHTVTARTCDANRCSEFSNSVRIRFGGDLAACSALITMERYRFWGVPPDGGLDIELADLPQAESELLLDWGDTSVEHITLDENTSVLHHVYKEPGLYGGTATVRYGSGCIRTLYFAVTVVESRSLVWWLAPTAGSGLVIWLGVRWQKQHRATSHPPRNTSQPKSWYNE